MCVCVCVCVCVCLYTKTLLITILSFPHLDQVGTCFVSQSGIKMTVEDAKCVQANAFIQAAMFRQYTYQGEAPIIFQINLAALVVRMLTSVMHSSGVSKSNVFFSYRIA